MQHNLCQIPVLIAPISYPPPPRPIPRNNLTALDMLVVQGRGAYGQLQFGSQRPGSSSPLLFELTEKHLKDCEWSWG